MRNFWSDIRGNMAVTFSLVAPVLIAAIAMGVDYTSWTGQQRKLQTIADIAALTAAKEMYLANADAAQITSVADSVAQAQLTLDSGTGKGALTVAANVINSGEAVEVIVSQGRNAFFSQAIVNNLGPLSARAVARAMGGGRVCVIGLDETASSTITLTFAARITAPQCGVYSNSNDSNGVTSYKDSVLTAELICSTGGTSSGAGNFEPEPLTDCPPIPDPLVDRAPPPSAGCDQTNLSLSAETRTLFPGVYCGGLLVAKDSVVSFEPGVYVMKDGPLMVTHASIIRGENVGFYFTGDASVFLFASGSEVDLTAPVDGPMAGLLFFEDRNSPELRHFEITSDNARNLVGTIYLPNGIFSVSSKRPVADQSAYTAIVARQIKLNRYPNLVINADYGATDVPVPSGLGPHAVGGSIILQH